MSELLIHSANICFSDKIEKSSVLIKDGKIDFIGNDIRYSEDAKVIEAEGKYLLPGFIDVHTHLDDTIGDYYLADTYESGSEIAIENGITTLYSFVTQEPGKSLSEGIKIAISKAKDLSYCNVGWHITPTDFDEGNMEEVVNLVMEGFNTIKLYTTYKDAGIYSSYDQIKRLAERLKPHDVTILVHCEDEEVLNSTDSVEDDKRSAYSHALERTEDAEIKAVEQIIDIAIETGVKFHIVHVSSYESVKLISAAREKANITCETCPQYFLLNEDYLKEEDGYKYLCTPPLRNEFSRLSMYEAVINNEVDLIATDHCAFSQEDKSEHKDDYSRVPKGMAGIGGLVPLTYELMKYKGDDGILQLCKMLSENPAKLIGKYPQKGCIEIGSDADLVLLSDKKERYINTSLSGAFNPYDGMKSTLNISYVLLGGEVVVRKNELVNTKAKGKLL